MSRAAAILWLSRRDRAVVAGALAGIVALAWAYILLGAGMDTTMNMAMGDVMMPMPWTLATFRVMLVMWIVMMTAMMLPSAAPMPITARVPEPLLAGRSARRLPYGAAAWAFLPRLLLGDDGAAVRRRPDERPVDRRARAVCPCRKGVSGRRPARAGRWRRPHSLGWRDVVEDHHRLSGMAWWRGSRRLALIICGGSIGGVAGRCSSTLSARGAWCL